MANDMNINDLRLELTLLLESSLSVEKRRLVCQIGVVPISYPTTISNTHAIPQKGIE